MASVVAGQPGDGDGHLLFSFSGVANENLGEAFTVVSEHVKQHGGSLMNCGEGGMLRSWCKTDKPVTRPIVAGNDVLRKKLSPWVILVWSAIPTTAALASGAPAAADTGDGKAHVLDADNVVARVETQDEANCEVRDAVIETTFGLPMTMLFYSMFFPPVLVITIPLAAVAVLVSGVVVALPYTALVYASGRKLRMTIPDRENFGCRRSWRK